MEKGCCDIKVAEIGNGYRIEITGDEVKERCGSFFKGCCSEANIKSFLQACCPAKK